MASVASTAARKCRTLVFCSQTASLKKKGPPLSVLRQHIVASQQEHLISKRSFYSMHELGGRRTKSTSTTKTTTSTRDSDLVVVLDLDECLVHSKFLNGGVSSAQHNQWAFQVSQMEQEEAIMAAAAAAQSADHQQQQVVDTFQIALPDGDLARVHQRPYLQDFLQEVSQKYETHLFTAGKQVYAESVLRQLDPEGSIFTKCLYRDDCTYDPLMKAYVKDLDQHFGSSSTSTNNSSLSKTVLVDNNHLSFLANPQNGILVTNFFDDPNDTTLLAVLDLLDELALEEDVRPVLEARFGLTEFLQRRQQHEQAKYEQQQQKKKKQRDKILETNTEQIMINASV